MLVLAMEFSKGAWAAARATSRLQSSNGSPTNRRQRRPGWPEQTSGPRPKGGVIALPSGGAWGAKAPQCCRSLKTEQGRPPPRSVPVQREALASLRRRRPAIARLIETASSQ